MPMMIMKEKKKDISWWSLFPGNWEWERLYL
jgi:hypothetical protein